MIILVIFHKYFNNCSLESEIELSPTLMETFNTLYFASNLLIYEIYEMAVNKKISLRVYFE